MMANIEELEKRMDELTLRFAETHDPEVRKQIPALSGHGSE
jgi:hypothetical protein